MTLKTPPPHIKTKRQKCPGYLLTGTVHTRSLCALPSLTENRGQHWLWCHGGKRRVARCRASLGRLWWAHQPVWWARCLSLLPGAGCGDACSSSTQWHRSGKEQDPKTHAIRVGGAWGPYGGFTHFLAQPCRESPDVPGRMLPSQFPPFPLPWASVLGEAVVAAAACGLPWWPAFGSQHHHTSNLGF